MSACEFDIVLYFYGEMDAAERARASVHLRRCEACRQRLEDLQAIRRALAERPVVDAPPAGDWSGFMRRLDEAVASARSGAQPAASPVLEFTRGRWQVRQVVALAAMLALVTIAVVAAARFGTMAPAAPQTAAALPMPAAAAPLVTRLNQSLREGSVEHLERSKLVVLGLTARDPRGTTAEDWQYERRLAGTLLADTRLYRMAAQDRGVTDVARVMRDLETVLLEASLSDHSDRDALARLQRLIARRDLVVKMQVVATGGTAGL
jgi:hypothetical protein